mmetsp:Transcript_24175/g.51262  ORF Transcript_24175/g.51262 Transcript_24175/m.51262 type:complete len:203 (+) Transcript_24175:421-1029(+)
MPLNTTGCCDSRYSSISLSALSPLSCSSSAKSCSALRSKMVSSSELCPFISVVVSLVSSAPTSSFISLDFLFDMLNQLSPLNKSSFESFSSTTGQNSVSLFRGADADHFPAIVVPALTTSPFPSQIRFRAIICTHSDKRILLALARCRNLSISSPKALLSSPVDLPAGAKIFASVSSTRTAHPALRLAHEVLCKAESVCFDM